MKRLKKTIDHEELLKELKEKDEKKTPILKERRMSIVKTCTKIVNIAPKQTSANASNISSPVTNASAVTSERTTRNKTNKNEVSVYLEDYFDLICSYQDETKRYLADVFYLLPSSSVKNVNFIIQKNFSKWKSFFQIKENRKMIIYIE